MLETIVTAEKTKRTHGILIFEANTYLTKGIKTRHISSVQQ